MKSILISGASGFLGGSLAQKACSGWIPYLTWYTNKIHSNTNSKIFQLDIQNREAVNRLVEVLAPDVIVHAAAMSNLAMCEENKEEAWSVNVSGTRNIAEAARKYSARLIYISTDLVFDGAKGYYSEDDIPNPVCYYGRTKYEGELAVADICTDYIILRPSLIFGKSKNSSRCSTEILIDNLEAHRPVNLYHDEYRTPVSLEDVTDTILTLADSDIKRNTYHICCTERISRFHFGRKIAQLAGLDDTYIRSVSSKDPLYSKYVRPGDCSMRNEKLVKDLKTAFMSLEEGILAMRDRHDDSPGNP